VREDGGEEYGQAWKPRQINAVTEDLARSGNGSPPLTYLLSILLRTFCLVIWLC
jgi:hypothetical protein